MVVDLHLLAPSRDWWPSAIDAIDNGRHPTFFPRRHRLSLVTVFNAFSIIFEPTLPASHMHVLIEKDSLRGFLTEAGVFLLHTRSS